MNKYNIGYLLIILIIILVFLLIYRQENVEFFTDATTIDNSRYDMVNRINNYNNEEFIYDIFARNGEIMIIAENRDIDKLKTYLLGVLLKENNTILIRDNLVLLIYKINEKTIKDIPIRIEYNDLIVELTLYHIYLETPNQYIASTTQFKFDYYLLPLYINYYLNQGIDHIYLYYNGKLNELNISQDILTNKNITIIEWDYSYTKQDGKQYSQMAQMQHAYFKYANIFYKFILLNDLDEYIVTENNTKLVDYVKKNESYDGIVFHNVWADTVNGEIPCMNSECKLPIQLYRSKNPIKYDENNGGRTKIIYKSNIMKGYIEVHTAWQNSFINEKPNLLVNKNNFFYHFKGWSPQLSFSTRENSYLEEPYLVYFNHKSTE
jgi:hypothetical protein